MQFGHVFKVHAVDTSRKTQWNEGIRFLTLSFARCMAHMM